MRYLVSARLLCLLACSGFVCAATDYQEQPFLTEAEGSACMGDDKSRKQTEEIARDEAKRRAAEQSATQVRAQSRVSIGTLEEDIIKIVSSGKVRIISVLDSKWNKEGCYQYRIRAEVTQPKPGELAGVALTEEEKRWDELENTPNLSGVDHFIASFPLSVHSEKAHVLQTDLELSYPRQAGPYLVYRDTHLSLRPATHSIKISEIKAGEILRVLKIYDAEWAVIKRDVGQVFTPFANLRVVSDQETAAWARCLKASKEARTWQDFLQIYPNSPLARLAKERLSNTQNRLMHEEGLSQQDNEEIALWNRCLKTRDLQCAREYRRRYPNGKFEKESWQIR